MSRILVSIIIDESYLARFAEIVENCKAAGMAVQREMMAVGVVSGTIDSSRIEVLCQIEGVLQVEESRTVRRIGKPPLQAAGKPPGRPE